jgi:transposase-like protein
MATPEYCPMCHRRYSVVVFNKPIYYWVCIHCKSVFVRDKEGIISMLNEDVKFVPQKSS